MNKEDFLNMLAQCLEDGDIEVVTDLCLRTVKITVKKPDRKIVECGKKLMF